MSDEQQPREIRIIADPVRGENYIRLITEGEEVREVTVEPAESWSDDDVRVALTQHAVRGSNTQVVRFSDPEAQELFGKLATYLLTKGLLTIQKPTDECGDYPAPCNHDPAHDQRAQTQQAWEDVQAFDALRDSIDGWEKGTPFEVATTFWRAGLERGRGK